MSPAPDSHMSDWNDSLGYLTVGVAGIGGRIKQRPGDFRVEEIPAYEPSGEGEHLFLLIEKQNVTTMQLIGRLARVFGVRKNDIGYAGLKDKHAVTRQYLSIWRPGAVDDEQMLDRLRAQAGEQIELIASARHGNKLRRGHLKGNRFGIRIRHVGQDALSSAQVILDVLLKRGVPNYHGPQRFGHRGNNHLVGKLLLREQWSQALDQMLGRPRDDESERVSQARSAYEQGDIEKAHALWPDALRQELRVLNLLKQGKTPRQALRAMDRNQKRFLVSSVQSAIFNRVLALRIEPSGPLPFDRLAEGDLAFKHDSGAVFTVDGSTAEIENAPEGRAVALEVSPTGPMWGGKMTRAGGEPGRIESQVLDEFGLTESDLADNGYFVPQGERRPLRAVIEHGRLSQGADEHGDYLQLDLQLPRGSFATVALREIMKDELAFGAADEAED